MSDAFFRDLNIPAPDIHLGIGSGSHAEQTGRVMIAFDDPEKIFDEANRALDGRRRRGRCPAIWDGHTAERIVRILAAEKK